APPASGGGQDGTTTVGARDAFHPHAILDVQARRQGRGQAAQATADGHGPGAACAEACQGTGEGGAAAGQVEEVQAQDGGGEQPVGQPCAEPGDSPCVTFDVIQVGPASQILDAPAGQPADTHRTADRREDIPGPQHTTADQRCGVARVEPPGPAVNQ